MSANAFVVNAGAFVVNAALCALSAQETLDGDYAAPIIGILHGLLALFGAAVLLPSGGGEE